MGNDNVKDYPPYLDYPKPRKPITNADRIRSMTDEELADFLDETDPVFWNRQTWLDWLKKEVNDGSDNR